MTLLDGEKVLFRSETGYMCLTSHRVIGGWERADFTTIMLEDICSVKVTRHHYRVLAIIGGIVLLLFAAWAASLGMKSMGAESLAAISNYERHAWNSLLYGAVLSGLFFLAYVLSRYREIQLASAGATIVWGMPRASAGEVAGFVDALEAAKNGRYMLLAGLSRVEDGGPAGSSASAAPSPAAGIQPLAGAAPNFCGNCGRRFQQGEVFCSGCGFRA